MHQVIHSIGTISRRVINILYVSTFCNDISTTYQRWNHLNSLVVQVGAAGRAPSDLRLRSVLLYERSPAAEGPVGEGGGGRTASLAAHTGTPTPRWTWHSSYVASLTRPQTQPRLARRREGHTTARTRYFTARFSAPGARQPILNLVACYTHSKALPLLPLLCGRDRTWGHLKIITTTASGLDFPKASLISHANMYKLL